MRWNHRLCDHRRGLGIGKTVSLDRVTLTSRRMGLAGRPDRLIKTDGTIIPEEWKSSLQCTSFHRSGDEQKALIALIRPGRQRLFRLST